MSEAGETPRPRISLAELAGKSSQGIGCPDCKASAEWLVYYTRPIPEGIRRVRICRACGRRIVTVEREVGR